MSSEQLKDWFLFGPRNPAHYEIQAKTLIEFLAAGADDTAFSMFHPSLKKAVPLEKLKEMMAQFREQFGAVKSIEHAGNTFDGDENSLWVRYNLTFEKGQTKGHVKFQFVGMQGFILGFNLNEK